MPSKLGFGNDRKSAGPAQYGSAMHYKNPIPMSSPAKNGVKDAAESVAGGFKAIGRTLSKPLEGLSNVKEGFRQLFTGDRNDSRKKNNEKN